MIPNEHAHLAVAAITHPGMSGKNNEDRYGVSAHLLSEDDLTPSLLAIVADGIGGHQAGEIAAEIAINTISSMVAESRGDDPQGILENAIIAAGQAVHAQSTLDTAQHGMGSTCACVWIIDRQLYTATIGDSRIYLLRDGQIHQLSVDHTWVQEAIEFGIIDPDQARGHPQAHIIRRYLGSKSAAEPDFRMMLKTGQSNEQALANQGMQMLPGDGLVLCSDGLTDLVDDDEIRAVLAQNSLEAGLKKLVDMANARGGHDNITIVTLEIPRDERPTIKPTKKSSKKLLWMAGMIVALLMILLVVALAFFTWRFTSPAATASPMPQNTLPALIETQLPPTQTQPIVPTTAANSTPEPTPIRATYTPWPTSTP